MGNDYQNDGSGTFHAIAGAGKLSYEGSTGSFMRYRAQNGVAVLSVSAFAATGRYLDSLRGMSFSILAQSNQGEEIQFWEYQGDVYSVGLCIEDGIIVPVIWVE